MHSWLYNPDIVLEIFTLVDKYNESKKTKKAFAVLCNLCSSEHKPTQIVAGGTLCRQPTQSCAAEHQLSWGFLFPLVECSEVLCLDMSNLDGERQEP